MLSLKVEHFKIDDHQPVKKKKTEHLGGWIGKKHKTKLALAA